MTDGRELHDRTRRHYDELVPDLERGYIDYRWKSGPVQRSHYRHTRVAIERALGDIGHVRTLLEVGVGPGTWTDLCLDRADHVTVCDLSVQMLEQARERLGSRVEYVHGDFLSDEVPVSGPYDIVASFRAIEYMDDKESFVARCRARLAEGGSLVVVTKNPGWRDRHRSDAQDVDEIHRHWIHWTDLMMLLADRGFDEITCRPVAVGSYRWPFGHRVGVALSDLWWRLIEGRSMRRSWDSLVESYLVLAEKR